VDLGGRALDLLHALAGSPGTVVDKRQLISRVWPTTTVSEGNLRYQVALLRKAMGDDQDLIKTVAGRGYLLVRCPPASSADESAQRVLASWR
jgi:DNA-binding winged helix-turn-helix (wHTH) protein